MISAGGADGADRQERGRSGWHGARGQREHDGEGMPYTARIAWIGHLRQALQQAAPLSGCGLLTLTELVKGKGNRG